MDDFRKLGEIASIRTGKLDSNAAKAKGKYPFFTCGQETLRTNTYSFDTKAVLLAGNNAQGVFPIKYFEGEFDVYQRTYVIESLNEDELITRYLFYALSLELEYFRNVSTGVTTKFLTLSILNDLRVNVPPITVQDRIVDILSSFDDLITINHKRIKILEEIAQSIYNEWFINFRYPGYENEEITQSSHGLKPITWKESRVKPLLKRLRSGTIYRQKDVEDIGRVPVIVQSSDKYLGFQNNEPDHEASPLSPIIAFGDHTCRMRLLTEPFSVGPNVVPFIPSSNLPAHFLFYLLKDLVHTREYKRHWTELNDKEVILPPLELCEKFTRFVAPILHQINLFDKINLDLKHSKDLVLPKLISGEIGISDIKAQLQK